MLFANIFSHSVTCLLVLLIVSFAVQKLFILMYSQYFVFAFVSLASRDMSHNKLLQPRSERFLLAFSSRILVASCLTFRCSIHSEFIFVYGVRKWSRYSFFCMLLSSFPSTTWRDCIPSRILSCFVEISWPYVCGSIYGLFCSIDLSVCSCASTIKYWWLQLCSIAWSLRLWCLLLWFSFSRLFGYLGSFPYKF